MFGKLKLYTVHVKPDDSAALENPVFVEEGFSVWAFFFGPLWAFYNRLWGVGLALLLVEALMVSLDKHEVLLPESIALLMFGYKTLTGYLANDWRRSGLARRGYALYDVVASDSELRASQRYFDRVVHQRSHA